MHIRLVAMLFAEYSFSTIGLSVLAAVRIVVYVSFLALLAGSFLHCMWRRCFSQLMSHFCLSQRLPRGTVL